MNELLQSLLRVNGVTSGQVHDIWRRLCYIIAGLLLACIIVFALNTLFGWHSPALILAMVFVPAAAFAWARPLFFLCVGIAGLAEKLASHATLAESLKDVFKAYSGVFKWATVAMVIYCFVMFFFSLNVNSSMAVTALFALVVVGVCLWAWPELFPGAWARKTVYWGSAAVVICGLLSQIPAPYWVKYVGWAPSFAPTVTEQTVYDIRKAQADNKEKSEDEVLKQILKNVRDGNALTTAEESLVTKKEAEAKTAKALAGATVDKLSSSDPSPSLTTVWKTTKKNLVLILLLCAVIYGVGKLVGGKWATAATLVAGFVLVLCFVVAPVGAWIDIDTPTASDSKRLAIPLASSPQSSWPKWAIPPGGKSESIVSPPGFHLVAAGNHFLLHAVYPDEHECSFGQVCQNASEIINYATNEAKETNIVPYAFAPN